MELPLRCQLCRLGAVSAPYPCPFHELRRSEGSVLVQQGERPESVWYLRRGQVVLASLNESGAEHAAAVRGPDSLLAMEALLGEPVPYRITALTDVVVCTINAAAFREWVGTLESPMGAVLHLALRESARRVNERQGVEGTAVRRVSRFLLQHHEQNENGAHIPQHVIANVLGMRAETLSRALAQLRSAGAIARGRSVRVKDLTALREAAGE